MEKEKKKGFLARLAEKLDRKMEEKAKETPCCGKKPAKGKSCCG